MAALGFAIGLVSSVLAGDWQSQADRYAELAKLPPPAGYPQADANDTFCEQSFSAFAETRREAFLRYAAQNPQSGVWSQLVLAERGLPVWEGSIYRNLLRIDRREDTADFALHSILRMLYQYHDSPAFSRQLIGSAERTVLDFKYWPDEPGVDSMCTWSENHHILFASAGYLAGQLYPEQTFTNSGWTGKELMAKHRPRVLRWLDLRYRTGFSEWLSNVYYDADMAALLSLIEFSEDEEIAQRATMVLDLMLADIACNQFHGSLACTHGRSYESHKKSSLREGTSTVNKLCFGTGKFRSGSMSGVSMVLSPKYQMPEVLYSIANDPNQQGMVSRQRMGIRVDEAARWGLGFDTPEDGMVWLSLEAYAHPKTLPLFVNMLDEFHWWQNKFFQPFAKQQAVIREAQRTNQLSALATQYEVDISRNLREEVNIYTYRTADYMLSTAQDYRAGLGGDQHSIWQATLGPDAMCFTTYPVLNAKATPDNWTGSGTLPRAAQHENVVIVIYHLEQTPSLYVPETADFTHAWLPRDRFDEVIERDDWVFARRGEGYLALWSSQPTHWQDQLGDDYQRELIADGRDCVWICELGCKTHDGTFEKFADRLTAAPISVADRKVTYRSPSQGALAFGWDGPLLKNDAPIPLHDYPRYENRFIHSDFPAERVTLQHGKQHLVLDWRTLERTTYPPLDFESTNPETVRSTKP
ncbi:hypothetical protein [Aeoliella mucimassa]|nr:hypothetical protein [Aeoliella mucimassa]